MITLGWESKVILLSPTLIPFQIRSFGFHKTCSVKIRFTNIFLFLILSTSYAQSQVSWEFAFDAENSQIVAEASIGEGWHLYSTKKASELGPIPTEFEFDVPEGVELVKGIQEPNPKISYDSNFDETLYYFEEKVAFVQELKVTSLQELKGTVTYMVCNDEMCMPPVDVEFTIELVHEN
jgi:thiol:disulfide interchange protein DsbD